ncbi:MAG: hypothetical protein GXO73_10460, partial [Calditrichaeota bacterium]|nr:hypothetical protein [Calditrichota bacterium]
MRRHTRPVFGLLVGVVLAISGCGPKPVTLPVEQQILPLPKQAVYYENLIPLTSKNSSRPAYAIELYPDPKRAALVAAAKDLHQWIAELAATQEVDSTPVVRIRLFSLPEGEARSAFVKKHGLKESVAWVHPEGYSLRFHKKKGVWLVDVVGADDHGTYYGSESLGQLLVKTPEGLALRRAKVDDWPTYSLRAFKSQAFEGSMWAMKD